MILNTVGKSVYYDPSLRTLSENVRTHSGKAIPISLLPGANTTVHPYSRTKYHIYRLGLDDKTLSYQEIKSGCEVFNIGVCAFGLLF